MNYLPALTLQIDLHHAKVIFIHDREERRWFFLGNSLLLLSKAVVLRTQTWENWFAFHSSKGNPPFQALKQLQSSDFKLTHQEDYCKTSPLLVLGRTPGWYLEGRVDLGEQRCVMAWHRPRKPHQCGFLLCWYQAQTFHVAFPFTLSSCLMLPKGKSHNEEASGQLPMQFTSSGICPQSPTKVRGPDITASMFLVIEIHKAVRKLIYKLLFQKLSINMADPDSSSCWYKCHKHYSAFKVFIAWPFTLISLYIP